MLNIEAFKGPGNPVSKSVSWLRGTINDRYSELNDVQQLKARKVLRLCDEAVTNGVARDLNTFHGKPLPDGYVYKFDALLNEANSIFNSIDIFNQRESNMLLSEFLKKWGFHLHNSVKGFDGDNEEYRSKDYVIDLYNTKEGITSYLLNKDRTHVLEVQSNSDGIFDEWDAYLSEI